MFTRTGLREISISAIHLTASYKQHKERISKPRHLLFEKTTGSSPLVSRNWSLQSSSHVLAYPSSNRTSRSRRMLTVAMRVSVVRFTQRESSMIFGEIAYRESPTASRRNWPDLHVIGTRQQLLHGALISNHHQVASSHALKARKIKDSSPRPRKEPPP